MAQQGGEEAVAAEARAGEAHPVLEKDGRVGGRGEGEVPELEQSPQDQEESAGEKFQPCWHSWDFCGEAG